MKLNLGFISEKMQDKIMLTRIDEIDKPKYITASPYVKGKNHSKDVIYVFEWDALRVITDIDFSAVFCVGGGEAALSYLDRHDIFGCICNDNEELLGILCDLQDIFHECSKIENDLLLLLSKNVMTKIILDKCAELFHAHVALYDKNFDLIDYSDNYLPPEDDKIWADTLKRGRCVIERVKRERVLLLPNVPGKYPNASYLNIDNAPPHYNYGFDYGDNRFATLIIAETSSPLSRSQHWMVDYICELIYYRIQERYNTGLGIRDHLRMVINNMLFHKNADVISTSSYFGVLNWQSDDLYRMIIVSLPKISTGVSHYLYNYENIFADFLSDCLALSFENNIIIILHGDAIHFNDEYLKTLTRQVEFDNAIACVGIPFQSYKQFALQYTLTLNTFVYYPNNDPVRFYQKSLPYFLSSELNYIFPLTSVCHYATVVLQEYDKKHSTQLLETLKIYLLTNKSLTDAAAMLFVHKNTVIYRLKCIEKIVPVDYNDVEERAYLLFSCIMLDSLHHFAEKSGK